MDIKKINVAIGLALLLLVVIIFIAVSNYKMKDEIVKDIEVKKVEIMSKSTLPIPRIEEAEETDYPTEKTVLIEEPVKEEPQAITTLEDLPLDSLISGQEQMPVEVTPEEIIEDGKKRQLPRIRPSAEDMKAIKAKGLIIY